MSAIDKDAVSSPHNKDSALPAGVAANESVSLQRRKLIKASAAVVPAVMTLRSGAAAAMGSTYSCTTRDNKLAMQEITTPEDFVLDSPDFITHDHWIRINGYEIVRIIQGSPVTLYCTETGPGGPQPADAWQCFDANGTEYFNIPPSVIVRGTSKKFLVQLHFDQYGNDNSDAMNPIQWYPIANSIQPAPPGYSPLTGSCLSSIHPNLILPG